MDLNAITILLECIAGSNASLCGIVCKPPTTRLPVTVLKRQTLTGEVLSHVWSTRLSTYCTTSCTLLSLLSVLLITLTRIQRCM